MEDKELLQKCFATLSTRLFELESKFSEIDISRMDRTLNEVTSEIFKCNSEETAQDKIIAVIEEIDELISRTPSIIEALDLNKVSYTIHSNLRLQFSGGDINEWHKQTREILVKTNLNELNYYRVELVRILTKLEKITGEKAAKGNPNSGFKIKFKLAADEIGSLFNALYDKGYFHEKIKKGDEEIPFTKIELGKFISTNVSSDSSENLSYKNMTKNYLNRNNILAEQKIVELLEDLLAHLKVPK